MNLKRLFFFFSDTPGTPVHVPGKTNSYQYGLEPASDVKDATKPDSATGIIRVGQEMRGSPPQLAEVKLLKTLFESPISDSGPVKVIPQRGSARYAVRVKWKIFFYLSVSWLTVDRLL